LFLFLFLKYVIFPINKLKSIDNFIIEREQKYGGDLIYIDLEQITLDYKENKLYPQDLKKGISDWLIDFLEPVRNYFESDNMKELIKNAYKIFFRYWKHVYIRSYPCCI
jgi:tyrosyl-tRNA synthetase